MLTLVLLGWMGNLIYGFVGTRQPGRPGAGRDRARLRVVPGRRLPDRDRGRARRDLPARPRGRDPACASASAACSTRLLRRVPLVGNVYDLSKRFVAIVDRKDGDSLQSMRPVWCFFGGEGGAAVLALCPLPDPIMIGAEPYTAVLVPSAPVPVGGCLIYVPGEMDQARGYRC